MKQYEVTLKLTWCSKQAMVRALRKEAQALRVKVRGMAILDPGWPMCMAMISELHEIAWTIAGAQSNDDAKD